MTKLNEKILIGVDFSINKPALCIFKQNKYSFFSWPYDLSKKILDIYRNSDINIIERTDKKWNSKEPITIRMRNEVENSQYLTKVIINTIKPYLNINTQIAFEGMSYGSSGNIGIQLGAYKYMLMNEMNKYVSLNQMYTYSPITIKSIAGCAEKGKTKADMINAFIEQGPLCKLRDNLRTNPDLFKKKGGKNWIEHLDDFIDSYFVLETLRNKEEF